MSAVARELIRICAKDLIFSEAKYHASCYKGFVRIIYAKNTDEGEMSNDTDCRLQPVYDAVYIFCEDLIVPPEIIEYKIAKELFLNKASELGVNVSESYKKNLMRELSNMFPELNFITYQYNRVLVYPSILAIDKVVLDIFELNSELESLKGPRSDDEENICDQNSTLTYGEIRDLNTQMSRPPTKEER